MQKTAQMPVSQMLFRGQAHLQWQQHRRLAPAKKFIVSFGFYGSKVFFSFKIN